MWVAPEVTTKGKSGKDAGNPGGQEGVGQAADYGASVFLPVAICEPEDDDEDRDPEGEKHDVGGEIGWPVGIEGGAAGVSLGVAVTRRMRCRREAALNASPHRFERRCASLLERGCKRRFEGNLLGSRSQRERVRRRILRRRRGRGFGRVPPLRRAEGRGPIAERRCREPARRGGGRFVPVRLINDRTLRRTAASRPAELQSVADVGHLHRGNAEASRFRLLPRSRDAFGRRTQLLRDP